MVLNKLKPSAFPKFRSALQSNWFLHAWNTTLDLFKAVASWHNWAAPVMTVCRPERMPWWPSQHSPTTAALHFSSCTRTAWASRKLRAPKGNLLWNRQQVHSSVYSSSLFASKVVVLWKTTARICGMSCTVKCNRNSWQNWSLLQF